MPSRRTFLGGLAATSLLAPSILRASPGFDVDYDIDNAWDISGSMNTDESGYACRSHTRLMSQALRRQNVLDHLCGGQSGCARLGMFGWNADINEADFGPSVLLEKEAPMLGLAPLLNTLDQLVGPPPGSSSRSRMCLISKAGTETHLAIRHGVNRLRNSPVRARRKVLNVITDDTGRDLGPNNIAQLRDAQAEAEAEEVVVNVMVIGKVNAMDNVFQKYVRTGPGSFVISTVGFTNYQDAYERKIIMDLVG